MMANEQNLRPPYSSSEAREYGHKGGIESGKSKRRKRMIKETIEIILDQPIKKEDMIEDMKVFGITDTPRYKDYLVLMILNRTAESGNMMDLVRLSGLLGESPEFNEDMLAEVKAILDTVPSVIDRGEYAWEREEYTMMLKSVDTGEAVWVELDAKEVDQGWKIGDIVEIDSDVAKIWSGKVEDQPQRGIHGKYEIVCVTHDGCLDTIIEDEIIPPVDGVGVLLSYCKGLKITDA